MSSFFTPFFKGKNSQMRVGYDPWICQRPKASVWQIMGADFGFGFLLGFVLQIATHQRQNNKQFVTQKMIRGTLARFFVTFVLRHPALRAIWQLQVTRRYLVLLGLWDLDSYSYLDSKLWKHIYAICNANFNISFNTRKSRTTGNLS